MSQATLKPNSSTTTSWFSSITAAKAAFVRDYSPLAAIIRDAIVRSQKSP